mmetsp:Transcript_9401/g.17147  ORF Transcript_9401/g.17147 Transcript_9401/m.17147 type:complete len:364 (-) Transcript_9401:2308-3399(-)
MRSDLGDLRTLVVVQAVDIVHNSGLVGFDSGKDEKVLEVAVVAELLSVVACIVENKAFEKLDELIRQIGVHESLHGDGHLLGALGGRERSSNDLVDELATVLVLGRKHLGPKVHILSHNEILGLILEEAVLGSDFDELVVAGSHRLLVCHDSQHRIATLAELSDRSRVVQVVLEQEALRLLASSSVDVDLGQTVVHLWVLALVRRLGFEPRLENDQSVDLFTFLDEFGDELGVVRRRPHGFEELLDELFRSVEVQKSADDRGGRLGVHALHIGLNELLELVLPHVFGQLVYISEPIADVDKRTRVSFDVGIQQEVLDLLGVVVLVHTANAGHELDGLGNSSRALDASLDALEHEVFIRAFGNE